MKYYDLRFQLKHAVSDSSAVDFGEKGYFFDTIDGVPHVSTAIEGGTKRTLALFRAYEQLASDGLKMVRAVPSLATISTIANRFEVTRQAAQRWKNDRSFPLPVITAGVSLWYWPEVREWAEDERQKKTYDDCRYPLFEDYAVFNAYLANPAHSRSSMLEAWRNRLTSSFLESRSKHGIVNLVDTGMVPTLKHLDFHPIKAVDISRFEPNFEADLEGGRFHARDHSV